MINGLSAPSCYCKAWVLHSNGQKDTAAHIELDLPPAPMHFHLETIPIIAFFLFLWFLSFCSVRFRLGFFWIIWRTIVPKGETQATISVEDDLCSFCFLHRIALSTGLTLSVLAWIAGNHDLASVVWTHHVPHREAPSWFNGRLLLEIFFLWFLHALLLHTRFHHECYFLHQPKTPPLPEVHSSCRRSSLILISSRLRIPAYNRVAYSLMTLEEPVSPHAPQERQESSWKAVSLIYFSCSVPVASRSSLAVNIYFYGPNTCSFWRADAS